MLIDFPRLSLDESDNSSGGSNKGSSRSKINLTPETSEQFFNTLKSFNK